MDQWYVSFHGGNGPRAWNNIHRFDLAGRPLGKALAAHTVPHDLELRELRGFGFGPDGALYVANAARQASRVLRFEGAPDQDGQHRFRDVFIERHRANPGLSHPFDVAFGPDGHLYVPSQDTNLVGRYFGPLADGAHPGQPMPHPAGLTAGKPGHLLPGTFVPSERHAPQGLRSARRAVFGPDGDLYVADRDAGCVKRFDGVSGAFRRDYRHSGLTTPVHLSFRSGSRQLLVGSRDRHAIFAIDVATGDVSHLIQPGAGGLKAPGGLAFGPDGRLYVCSRETRQILRFDAESGAPDPDPFVDGLEDYPEFMVLVRN